MLEFGDDRRENPQAFATSLGDCGGQRERLERLVLNGIGCFEVGRDRTWDTVRCVFVRNTDFSPLHSPAFATSPLICLTSQRRPRAASEML